MNAHCDVFNVYAVNLEEDTTIGYPKAIQV